MPSHRIWTLPWDDITAQEQRFWQTTKRVTATVVGLALLLALLPLPERQQAMEQPVPPRLARLVLERPEPPPPPPVVQQPREEPVIEPPPAPVEPVPQQRVVERQPEPQPVERPPVERPVDRVREARERASSAGVLQFADQLASLRDNQAVGAVTTSTGLAGAAGEAARVERSLVTSPVTASSGGVNTAALSRDTGGAGLAGRETTRVASTLAGTSGPEPEAVGGGERQRPSRSREEIEMVFDQNKGAIYALYNRALRQNPSLQGKLVVQLTIEPSGEVSAAEVVSSELDDEELERRLIQRVRMFRFSDRDVAPVTTTKPIDFFPA